MKRLIFQYYSAPGPIPEWAAISIDRFKAYAKTVGADYLFSPSLHYSPESAYFEHLRLVYDSRFDVYDRILYVDVDVIVERPDQDIFDIDVQDVGMVPEYKAPGMNATPLFAQDSYYRMYADAAAAFGIAPVPPKSVEGKYLMFNSGVILWSRSGLDKAKQTFADWKTWNRANTGHMALDQPFINGQVTTHLDYTELDLKWNCFPALRFDPGHAPSDVAFVHYTGGKKQYIEKIYKGV